MSDDLYTAPPASTNRVLDSPPPSPPSPANSDTDTKLSRKREREGSLEPATTPKSNTDSDPFVREYKDARTPAKKNRLHLDSTAEEEDGLITRSRSPSPGADVSVSVSPPQEMKMRVRQISQGVEDLSWQNMQNATPQKTTALAPFVGSHSHSEDSDPMESADGSAEIKVDAEEPPSSDGAVEIPAAEDAPPEPSSLMPAGLPARRDESDSDSGEKEKGLKRKFLERGTSAGPQENGDESKASAEPLKRLRDDPDKDENPRETKRPSPPPEPNARKSPPPAASPKLSGFMAYASTSSPFASVKGQNLFASKKATSSIPFAASTPVSSSPRTPAGFGEPSSPPSSTKRAVFGSSSSPFAASAKAKQDVLGSTSKLGRAKSPTRRANPTGTSAFSAYASGGAQGFSLPAQKRVRSGSPDDSGASSVERATPVGGVPATNGSAADSGAEDERDDRPVTFGEKLRAGKDEEEEGKSDEEGAKPVLTEQEFTTGEEEEETLHQVRGKLFSLVDGTQWKERGTGTLKLNVRRSDGGGARLVMRKEAVYTVLLNVTLFHGMRCTLAQDPRYLRLSVLEGGGATHYNLRVGSAKAAQELLNEINANLPTA
ncbi:hypothetical protein B0H17DRAFT_929523 [Mycena rosella]|uniref:RanBD1 domain-containing protein n=1 Tax=Mycena rosella TaxID=1033263 RepID=A0AAD7GNS5_MYCRO|nr:hypothetical protein B0H17DRAFT_929523 [Mycena rosella]